GVLRAETLRFADELRRPDEIGVDNLSEPSAEGVRSMRAAIKKLSKARVAATDLKDTYWQRVEKLVEKKKAQHKDVVPVPSGAGPEGEGEGAEIIDLMALLQKSLAKSRPGSSPARPGVKKTRGTHKGGKRKAG
ncbi:MAG TPA: hypothetical protein VJU61_24275, partial [Polyangiaceae bacterium]|nr:hypothetical protein [Polyangiaceae bacterium]